MSWPFVKLKDCVEVVSGGTPKREEPSYWNGDIYWVTPKDLSKQNNIYLHETPEKITKLGLRKSSANLLPVGTVLFSSRAPIGHVAITKIEMASNQGFKSLVPKEGVDSLYLYFCMKFFKPALENLGNGATFKEVSKKVVENFEVPLPPLPVQKQIAAVLEKADTLRQQSQQMEQEFNLLAQAVFLDMFGDPKDNPRGWEKRTLGQLVSKLVGGKSLAAPEEQNSEITNRVLKISAVTSGEFNPKESKPLPQDYCPPKDHYVKVNDLLFSRANTTELVGATCIVFETPENVCLPDKLWRFEWQEPEKLSQIFMWKLLNTPAMRNRLSEISSGSGGSMKNISKSKLLEMEVIFPDYDKQLEYEVFYLKLRRQMAMRDRYYIEAENIFNSSMQRAFTGELDLKDVA